MKLMLNKHVELLIVLIGFKLSRLWKHISTSALDCLLDAFKALLLDLLSEQ